jgi:transcriptional regulator with XRE-family HTH domain
VERNPWKRDPRNNLYAQWPVPEMVIVGARFRNGRIRSGLSQRRLAALAGVSQSNVSRFERGVATGTSAERVIRMATAIGPHFPFGFCPHGHRCAYPFDPRGKSFIRLE